MAKKINWASSANDQPIVPDSLMSGTSLPTLNQERWSEHFQDLSDYCNTGSKMADSSALQSGEQLNTPNITVQDEFDFGLRSSSGERFDTFDDGDPWEAQPFNTTQEQTDWATVKDWLSSNRKTALDDPKGIYIIDADDIDPEDPPFDIITNSTSDVKPVDDYLLSSSPVALKQPLPPQSVKELNREQSYIDLLSLLKPEQASDVKQQALIQHSIPVMDEIENNSNNNNMNININNAIVICNNNSENDNCFPIKSCVEQEQNLSSSSSSILLTKSFKLIKPDELVNDSSLKNRRDPVYRSLNNLSSIFKSEEPLISETNKQSSCIANNSDIPMMNVASIIIRPKAVVASSTNCIVTSAASSVAVQPKFVSSFIGTSGFNSRSVDTKQYNVDNSSDEYVLPEIKSEPIDITDMEVEDINEHNQNSNDGSNSIGSSRIKRLFKIPDGDNNGSLLAKKPGLKLDINSASRLVTSVVTPVLTPTTTSIVCETNVMLSTPDVLKPLLNGSTGEFNLLTYISEDGSSEDLSSNNMFSTNSGKSSPVVDSKPIVTRGKPVKRLRKSKAIIVEKCEPATYEQPVLPVVKEEPYISDSDDEPMYDESHAFENESVSSKQKLRTTSKRRRVAKKSEDMEFDLGNISDFAEEDDEKHDKTFQLTPYKRKRTISSTSRTSASSSYTSKRKASRDSDSSDHESISSGVDRYRELRDRNNEASRRSRLNRKSRELETIQQAIELELENKRLKAKADEMERLVKRLREGLMQLVLKKR